MTPPQLRLLADDLTGALDTAAEWTTRCGGSVRVVWNDAVGGGSAAIDSGTREMPREAAVARVRGLAPLLAGAGIAFKKVDSLLRGHVAAELAACLAGGAWAHCVVAPALPALGRITQGGRVLVRQAGGDWAATGPDLIAALQAEGLEPRHGDASAPLPPGVSVFDAGTDADLARIAGLARSAAGPVLWCGTAGLSRALAGDAAVRPATLLRGPVLGFFGSDQAVTARQLAACGAAWIRVADGSAAAVSRVSRAIGQAGAALVSLDLPDGLGRVEAAQRIARDLGGLARGLPRPGTLIVAGGETLRAVCDALGAAALDATGIVARGVPRSVMRDGAWDGVDIVSKSGAFGDDTLWRDLLAGNGILFEGIPA